MTAQNFGPCNLHIPHKDWSRNLTGSDARTIREDQENWEAIERWVNERFPNCKGVCYIGYGSGSIAAVASGVGSTVTPAMSTTCGTLSTLAREVIVAVSFPGNATGYRHLQIDIPSYSPAPVKPGQTVPGVNRAAGQLLSATALVSSSQTYTFTVEQTSGGPQAVSWSVWEMADCSCTIPTGC